MGNVKTINGNRMEITPQAKRLGGIVAGVLADEAVNKAQLDAVQQGTVDVTRIELASAGTAAAPAITWDGDTDTGIYQIGANNIGITANGAKVVDIATTGVTITGATATTTTLNVGTDQTFTKEVNHTVSVSDTTTAATVGGNLTVIAGLGLGATGGAMNVSSGAADAGFNSGLANFKSGNVTGAGVSGAITVNSGTSASGNSGSVTYRSGAVSVTGDSGLFTAGSGTTASGTSGAVTLSSGTGTTSTGAVTIASGNGTTASGNVSVSSGTGVTTGTMTVSSANATTTAGALTISTGTASTTGGLIRVDTGNISAGTSAAIQATTGTGTTGTGAVGFTTGIASAGGSGAFTATTGAGTTSTGAITLTTGAASAGTAGNITLAVGTASSTTVSPTTIIASNTVNKPLNTASVATGAAITGRQLVDGYIAITGGTGNVTLPSTADITTAIGATPAGTVLDFTVNATGMTATNTATFVVGANMSVASAPAITGGGTLTLTQDTQVIGVFKLVFITSTTTKLFRIA